MELPYVGITGFMKPSEVETLLKLTDWELFERARRVLAVGVLVSSKTLDGKPNSWPLDGKPNSWPGRYPKVEDIAAIFAAGDEHCHNIIHFNTDFPDRLAEDLERLKEIGGKGIKGVQLNMFWPEVEPLANFKAKYPGARIILQLGKKVLDSVRWDPFRLQVKLVPYQKANAITDVLYNPNGGKGLEVETPEEKFYSYIGNHFGFGFAGGLAADKLKKVYEAAQKWRWISVDAEARLRTPEDKPRTNQLDLCKAYAYLVGTLGLFVD